MFAKFSVKKPLTVFVAVFMIIILGFVSFTKMTPDLLPSINLPYALVITAYPGATPEEVEAQVSKPLEQAMASLENINDVSSVSADSSSRIMLQFADGANMDTMVSDIREKINGVSGSWDDKVGTPYIIKLNPDLLPVTVSAVEFEGKDNVEMTEFLNNELKTKLEGISGVASVSVSGDVQEQVDVIISEEKLKKVNDKIRKSLDGEFADAQQELDDKRQELEDGKNELSGKENELSDAKDQLEDGQNQLLDKTSQAQGQLIDKKLEIAEAKAQIQGKIAEAKNSLTQLKEMRTLLSSLNSQYKATLQRQEELDTTVAALEALSGQYIDLQLEKESLEEQIAALAGTDPTAPPTEKPDPTTEPEATPAPTAEPAPTEEPGAEPTAEPVIPAAAPAAGEIAAPQLETVPTALQSTELERLKAELSAVEARITATEASMSAYGVTPDTIEGKILALEGEGLVIESTLAGINEALASTGIGLKDMDSAIEEIDGNIGAIEGGISQMEAMLPALESGSVTVSEALSELNRQQLKGTMEISAGLSQIMVGQSSIAAAKSQMEAAEGQIDTAEETFEDQKKTAYKSANLEITMDMVNQILAAQNFSMPVGYITDDDIQYLVRVGDKVDGIEELQNLALFDTGIDGVGEIYLKDVAEVHLTDNAADLYAKINGSDGVILSFQKQSTYATATVSENIQKKFQEMEEKYPGLKFSNLSDQGDYIDIVINTVLMNLLQGAALAILILLFFLKDIKPTFVIACSIPISVLVAIVLMYFSGITLNVISLSGLAVGVGMLVDNSVVVIENIYRMRSEGKSAMQAAVAGATQVTGAIVASTLTTICVFLPIVFVEGLTRQLFVDLALTIAYSLLASLLVAITLVPAMASGMLRNSKEKEHKLFDKFLDGYERLAKVSLRHKWVVFALSIVLLVGSTFLCLQKGFIFMPSMSGTQISVTVTPPEDATFGEKQDLADAVYSRVSTIEELETVGITIANGSGMSMMGGGGGDISMYAILKSDSKLKDTEVSAQIIENCKDLDCEIAAQGAMDMGSYMTSMSGAGVNVKIYGNELDGIIAESASLAKELEAVEGLKNISTGLEDASPEIRIVVNKEKAMRKGLTVAQVYQKVAEQVKSETTSTSIKIENYDKDIVIYSEKNQGMTVKDVGNLSFAVQDKEGEEKTVVLSSIADIQETKSLTSINRENQRRYLTLSAEVAEGYNVTKVTDAVRQQLSGYEPQEGNTVEIGGESDTIMDAVEQLMYMALMAVAIIYFIMVAQFQSFRSPFIVMFTIPLAFTGGFIALLLTGHELSVVSLVGFIMLAGIIVNNGIVLIDYINILRLEGMEKKEAILLAGRTRMRPILMTALTTVLGLMFMAVGTGFGSELMQPMAIVCIGGLLYATLMTLFVVPAMYDIFSKKHMEKREIE